MLIFTSAFARAGEPSSITYPPEPLDNPILLKPDQQREYVNLCPDSHPYLARPLEYAVWLNVDGKTQRVDSSGENPNVRGLEVRFLPTSDGRAGVFSFKVDSAVTQKTISVLWPLDRCTKSRPPSCERIPGTGQRRTFRFQDPIAGLKSIRVITRQNVKLTLNGNLVGRQVPIQVGTRDPVLIHGNAILPNRPSVAEYEVTNMHGEARRCDPVFARLTVGPDGLAGFASHDVASAEGVATVSNGPVGLSILTLTVDGRSRTITLRNAEERSLDISSMLGSGAHNRVSLVGRGHPGAEAQVTLWEGPEEGEPVKAAALSALRRAGSWG